MEQDTSPEQMRRYHELLRRRCWYPSARRRHPTEGSCNIFRLPSMTRIDLLVRRPGAFDDSEFERRSRIEVRPGETLYLKAPEDTVLRKLLGLTRGGHVSGNQWRDILEVLRVSGPTIDMEYLNRWAHELSLSELFARAVSEAKF